MNPAYLRETVHSQTAGPRHCCCWYYGTERAARGRHETEMGEMGEKGMACGGGDILCFDGSAFIFTAVFLQCGSAALKSSISS